MISRTGFVLSAGELSALAADDFGPGYLESEGTVRVDLLRSARAALITLPPGQCLQQDVHPPQEGEAVKEETVRVLWGQANLCVPGPANNPNVVVPPGQEAHCMVCHEVIPEAGDRYTISPNTGFRVGRRAQSPTLFRIVLTRRAACSRTAEAVRSN